MSEPNPDTAVINADRLQSSFTAASFPEIPLSPTRGDPYSATAQLSEAERALARALTWLGAQLNTGMARQNVLRQDLAQQTGLGVDKVKAVQAGDAGELTIRQLHLLASALKGELLINIRFAGDK